MLSRLACDAEHVYLAMGATDFRKQASSLVSMVSMQFGLDPFTENCVFIFCNKRRNSIKVLRYDKNGFILASKKLLEKMKFQWPKDSSDVKEINIQQVTWLLQGLEIEQKKAHHNIKIDSANVCF